MSLNIAWQLLARLAFSFLISTAALSGALADEASTRGRTVAFLGVQLKNDNESLEPTTDAERARTQLIEDIFKFKLEVSGRFKFVPVSPEIIKEIAEGQKIGECHGCEIEYGQKLHADLIAWIKVQKVSNLILNMNVYMADVATKKMTFIHSVDIRGNTNESWARSLAYLVDNYLLATPTEPR